MKVVILAGGFGTRISEETSLKPKPMVEIGSKPIIWHIMKMYSHYGFNDFIICCGFKGYVIKEYFNNFFAHSNDLTIDFADNTTYVHKKSSDQWKVTLIDTGLESMTGGRLKRVKDYVKDETFCFTYGDGLSNINIKDLIDFHNHHGKQATVTAVQPGMRFGVLDIQEDSCVTGFREKNKSDGAWINGGFFVLEPSVIDLIDSDDTVWEKEPLQILAKENQLCAFKHKDFWQPMDTLRERIILEELWQTNQAPWKVWD